MINNCSLYILWFYTGHIVSSKVQYMCDFQSRELPHETELLNVLKSKVPTYL